MATNTQRWQAICEGLLNRPATLAEQQRLGAALAHGADAAEYELMTDGQKVAYAVAALRRQVLGLVKRAESAGAEYAARASTATTVDTDFAEP